MPHQSGLAGLARPGDHNHWIAAGEVLKPGFGVPGDVGHGGFWLLYMPALCVKKANCQYDCQLAYIWRLVRRSITCRSWRAYTWKSKSGRLLKVLYISVQSAIFFEHFEGFSEHGIFHGFTIY
jgi:hypothetical protein